jgi:hypothetical protein
MPLKRRLKSTRLQGATSQKASDRLHSHDTAVEYWTRFSQQPVRGKFSPARKTFTTKSHFLS